MTILSGGVWCNRAFDLRMQCDSPALVTTRLNQWLQLTSNPRGFPHQVLKASISHGDYIAAPSDSSKRAEVQSLSTTLVWGTEYVYYWRIIIPEDWINYGASSYAVVMQCHDINAPGVGRRPALAAEIIDNILYWTMSNTATPFGISVYNTPISAGQELEFTLRANWADGTLVPAANGVFDLYHNDILVYSLPGQKNTWDNGAPSEPNPPYIKAGIYQPNSTDAWWLGRQLSCFHIATIVASADETPQTLRSFVDDQIRSTPNQVKPILASI